MLFLHYGIGGTWVPYQAKHLQAAVERGGPGFAGRRIGRISALAVVMGKAERYVAGATGKP